MVHVDRRRFLQLAGGAAAASAMSSGFLGSIDRAAAVPARRTRGTIEDVEHVVVLMQENRSFDHYHGSMRGVRGFGDPHPAILPGGRPVWFQPTGDPGRPELPPFHPAVDDLGAAYLTGTPHSWTDGHAAIDRGVYDGWVPAKGTATMAYLRRQDAMFHHALADAFTICDAYHCSFIGNTDPNRYYMWTGWTGNDGTGGGPVLYNDELGYDWPTYPERLEAAGVSWKVYQDVESGLDSRAVGDGIPTRSSGTTATRRCCTSTPTATRSPGTRSTNGHARARTTRPVRTTSRSSPPTSPPAGCPR